MRLLTLFTFIIVLAACGGGDSTEKNEIPEDLDGKRTFLKEKKAELKELRLLVAKVEEEIGVLDPASKIEKRQDVTTAPIEIKDFKRYVEIQGSIQSDNTFNSSSEVGGRVISFSLKEGDMVKKGQLIAKLDLETINKNVAEVQKSRELAVDLFERQKRLWEQKIGSEVQYLQAKNSVERLDKTLETLAFQLTKANVYANASGMVNQTFIKSGDIIAPGQPLIEILNLNLVKVVADVPENYIKVIRKGESVTVKIPALEKERQARVTLLGQIINPANRTFKVEINLSNGNKELKPNLLAIMLLKDYESKNMVVLPSELIQQELSGRNFVYVKESGEKGDFAKKIVVETGESFEGETEIKEGLTGDEAIIVKGARSLTDGGLIKVQE